MDSSNSLFMACRICGHPVTIATCTVDEQCSAVHEECYAQELLERSAGSLIVPPRNENDGMDTLAFANVFIPMM